MNGPSLLPGHLTLVRSAPLYERTVDAVRAYIDIHDYDPGDQLPSQSVLASELGVSRSTLREALAELKNRGEVDSTHGVGTFVAQPPRHALIGGLEELKSLKHLSSDVDADVTRCGWCVEMIETSRETVRLFNLPEARPVVRVRSAASIGGVRCATFDSVVFADLVDIDQLERYESGSLLDYLMESSPSLVDHASSDLAAAVATGQAADWLLVEDGEPVLRLTETFYSREGDPVVFSLNTFRTEIVSFHIVRRPVR